MKRTLPVLGVPVALMLVLGCSPSRPKPPAVPETVSGIAVIQTANARVSDDVVAVGTVRAAETTQLSAQTMGNVVAITVREGDFVKRGQILVTIDPAQAQASLDRAHAAWSAAQHEVAAAESQKNLAEATLKRYDTLFQRRSVSPQEFDEVKARAQSAQAAAESAQAAQAQATAAVAQAQSALGYTKIRAPFDGVVTERRVDPGALASPGTPLLTVESTGHLRLEAAVDEADLRFVRLRQTVSVIADAYPDQALPGNISQIVPAADAVSRSFLVKIELPGSSWLRSGMFARARFPRGQRNALLIPKTAVIERGSLKGVFVVADDNIASLRYVTLGEPTGEKVEVLSGLGSSEYVVLSPGARELGGKRVEVR